MRRYFWFIPTYLLSALVPLLVPVGRNFEYEYALLASYTLIILLPLAALFTSKRDIPTHNGRYDPFVRFDALCMLVLGPFLMFAPAALAFGARLCRCSFNGYIVWMLLLCAPAWILGHAAYHFVLYQRAKNTSRVRLTTFLAATLAVLLLSAATRLWINPQKRLLDLVLGFVHGPIYDSALPLDHGIVFARLAHLFYAFAMLLTVWGLSAKRRLKLAVLLLFIGLGLSIFAYQFPSVPVGKTHLDELLSGTKQHRWFTLHYNALDKSPSNEDYARQIFEEASFHADELAALFKSDAAFVHIYLYPDETKKKLWFGGGSTDVADVFTPSIHITREGSPHPTLRHELVHAMASNIGYHGLGFHPNMVLTEGLAVALAPEEDEVSLHEGVAMLYATKRMPSVLKLFSPLFWQESGHRAYTVAGSILLYLIDTHGIEGVKKLYGGASWQTAFGQPKRAILVAWRQFVLDTYKVDPNDLVAESLFRYPGIFNDYCPHSKADLAQNRAESIYTRLRQPLGWLPETDYVPWRLLLDPKDRVTKVRSLRSEAKQKVDHPSMHDTLLDRVEAEINWPPKTLEDLELKMLASDLALIAGETINAKKWLTELEQYRTNHQLNDGTQRAILARTLLAQLPPSQEKSWRKFLAGWKKDFPVKDQGPEAWIVAYLRLRNGDQSTMDEAELKRLSTEAAPTDLPKTFYVEWHKNLATAFRKKKLYADALAQLTLAVNYQPKNRRDFLEMEIRRLQKTPK